MITERQLDILTRMAVQLGAGNAGAVAPADIVVQEKLAALCNGNPRCEHYGQAPSCPPHVSGPDGIRRWIRDSQAAIVVRIEVPTATLFSHQRRDVMQLLHEIVAGVEKKAVDMGYGGSKAFAGGSCKTIFCHDQPECRVLAMQQQCRHRQSARPSMSGFGIDVARLMQACGWPADAANPTDASDGESMSWVGGLILVAENEDRSAGTGSTDP